MAYLEKSQQVLLFALFDPNYNKVVDETQSCRNTKSGKVLVTRAKSITEGRKNM